VRALREVRSLPPGERRRLRRERYRRIGAYREVAAGDGAAIAGGRGEAPLNGGPGSADGATEVPPAE
jgi:hypothetical protein